MKINQARLEVEMDSKLEKLIGIMEDCQEMITAVMEACLEKTVVTDLGANPQEVRSVAEHQELLKEQAAMEIIGALENPYGERHLSAGRRRQPKKHTQCDCGPGRTWPPPADR
jgi:hypothetical protein